MKNIGIVTTWFERGAAYVSRQYEQLLQGRFNVFIYARGGYFAKGDPSFDRENVWWGKVSGAPVAAAVDIDDMKRWITEEHIDVVLFNEQSWWPPVLACAELPVLCGAYIDYYTEETVPFFDAYDFVICNTRRHYSVFEQHPQAYYIPWGVDLDLFQPRMREENRKVMFFHSCGLSPWRKGTDLLLKAALILEGDFSLLIHTQRDLSVLGTDAARAARTLTERRKLEIVHRTIPAPGLYHRADVYVYPSRLDGLGLTLPEAIASGLAVVATDHPPMNEFLHPDFSVGVRVAREFTRHDGYYWPMVEIDVPTLADSMSELLKDRTALTEKKRAARVYSEKELDWSSREELLAPIFSRIQKRVIQPAAVESILRFEHAREGWRQKLYNSWPGLVGALNRGKKRLTRRSFS